MYGVRVKPEMLTAACTFGPDERADFGNRLNCPNLIVRHHDANQYRVVTQRRTHIVEANDAAFVNRQSRHVPALFLEMIEDAANGRMFDR